MQLAYLMLASSLFGVAVPSPSLDGTTGLEWNSGAPPADTLDFGFLKITAPVDSFFVVLDQNYRDVLRMASEDSVAVRVGSYSVMIVSELILDQYGVADVASDSVAALVFQPRVPSRRPSSRQNALERILKGQNLEVATDYDTDIYLGERWIGRGLAGLDTIPGSYRIDLRNEAAGSRSTIVLVPANRVRWLSMHVRPTALGARTLAPFPGAAQLYKRERWKGALLLGAAVAASSTATAQQREYASRNQEYEQVRTRYAAAPNEEQAYALGLEAQRLRERAGSAARNRDLALYAISGLIVFSVVDAWRTPRGGFRHRNPEEGGSTAGASVLPLVRRDAYGLAFNLRF